VEFWEYAQGPLARVVSSKSAFDLNLPADVDLILDALQAWLRVDRFFQDNDQAIRDHWFEIKRMSDDLVAHAVEYRLLDGLPPDAWYSDNEIADPNAPRQTVGGIVRAVSPITDSNVPTPDGIANLKQMCRYAIYHASFFHSWSHNRQTEDGGEVLYASLGLRNGAFGDEADLNVAPTAKDATVQLFLGNALVAVDYGDVIKNEDGDVPQALINLLEARRGDFNQIGINPDEIRSCTNT